MIFWPTKNIQLSIFSTAYSKMFEMLARYANTDMGTLSLFVDSGIDNVLL